jgi:two-component system, OmpR family, phosphate regulon sensor histidine kinase PhoR
MGDFPMKDIIDHIGIIIDSLPSYVLAVSSNGILVYMNKKAEVFLKNKGIALGVSNIYEIAKRHQVSDENENVNFCNTLENILVERKVIKDNIYQFVLHGRKRYFSMSINPILDQEVFSGSLVICNDVTEEYIKDIQLKEERQKFIDISTELKSKCDIIEILRNREKEHLMHLKDVINNISEGLIVLDNKGKFNFSNKAVFYIIEINPGEIVHYPNINKRYETINLEGQYVELKELFKSNISIKNLVLLMVDKLSGEEKYIEFNVNPIFNNKKELVYTIITLKDVSSIMKHSMELEKINILKDEFFTVMSHELRTPLTLIYSSLQLAFDIYGEEITPNLEKTLNRININCSRLLKLINNILDISKAEAGFLVMNPVSFEVVSTTEMIVNSVNNFAESRLIELIFDTNEEEMYVKLDKDKYEKILLNLLSNAIKFTPESKSILITLHVNENGFTLSVKDEGVGIPESKLQYIFDRFAQVNSSLSRRAEGTGLGLSLVKKLVELMGGSISVKSQVDRGSEFVVNFNEVSMEPVENLEEYSIVNSNIKGKINIEFSDID